MDADYPTPYDGRWLVWVVEDATADRAQAWKPYFVPRAADHFSAALLARDAEEMRAGTLLMVTALPGGDLGKVIEASSNDAEIPGPRWYELGAAENTNRPRFPSQIAEHEFVLRLRKRMSPPAALAVA